MCVANEFNTVRKLNILNFDFSEMTTDQINTDLNEGFSTDMPMPSSPPPNFFNFVNGDEMELGDLWSDINFTGQNDVPSEKIQTPRRSPRKHR